MIAEVDTSAESAVLDCLCDEDGELDINAALNVLLDVVAGLCTLVQRPDALATHFAETLQVRVAERDTPGRMLS